MIIQRTLGILIAAGLLAAHTASAEGPVMAGEYSIYANAMTAETLNPEIATLYRIQRSKLNGILTVSVVKPNPEGTPANVPARVEATARTGDTPASVIPMREIRVGEGVSYVGQFPIANLQIVDFAIQVTPPGGEPTAIELQQQFFID
ncbi:DUF4426 domain-containing protein [Thiocapsa rosea]|uniref:Uncharacterized protein DUF4426 n=1 Tax=Thiocapsa rosea TaxID=69360 RepID=A0A495V6G7_9GAMM|nr:DUF4426 domain-containing protein [Thiocapsa rosea]RKT44213.1 uncharacterized protein DUF4426 [Thiocapsa rosea]